MNKIIEESAAYITSRMDMAASIGIISGSGWDLTELIDERHEIPYTDIPGFPCTTVEGHKGRVVYGACNGRGVIIMQGRFHYYEGFGMEEITVPVEVLSASGVRDVIITNAAGGIRPYFRPGDFMVITDHINLMGINPLRGIDGRKGHTRFVDMSEAYDRGLINMVLDVDSVPGLNMHCGILAAVCGPSYETPAETQMLKSLGADAVCMSTIPEVIMCRYLGMRVLGISLITNNASITGNTSGPSVSPLSHEDVVRTVESRNKDACRLISAVIKNMPR